jgi:hypothetical protein
MISNALHWLAHLIDSSPCRCNIEAYMAGWRTAHRAQEKRHQLIAAGVDVRDAERYEQWLRRNAA